MFGFRFYKSDKLFGNEQIRFYLLPKVTNKMARNKNFRATFLCSPILFR